MSNFLSYALNATEYFVKIVAYLEEKKNDYSFIVLPTALKIITDEKLNKKLPAFRFVKDEVHIFKTDTNEAITKLGVKKIILSYALQATKFNVSSLCEDYTPFKDEPSMDEGTFKTYIDAMLVFFEQKIKARTNDENSEENKT